MMLNNRALIVLVAGVIAIVAVMWFAAAVTAPPAHARDLTGKYAGSPHAEWFKSQHNSLGEWCCDRSDGNEYYGDYTINPDGSVTVEGETIPKEKVLHGPNPTGAAVWWKLGSRTYCFAVGSGA